MSLIQQVLALYQGVVKTGDSVELKLWCQEGKEFFTFSRSLANKRRKERKRKRRQFIPFSQSFSGPQETQQSMVRSQAYPWIVVINQNIHNPKLDSRRIPSPCRVPRTGPRETTSQKRGPQEPPSLLRGPQDPPSLGRGPQEPSSLLEVPRIRQL